MTQLTVLTFVAVYVGMALGRWPGLRIDRTGIALLGAILLSLAGAVDGPAALAAIDFPTLIILFGLMVLSAQFAVTGFYDWCSARIAAADAGPATVLALVIATGGVLSAVLANDVVVFAMTPMLCAGLRARGLDPRPFLIALACAANAGSAATIIGNPQNILIGQYGDLDFWRFLAVCAPPALAGLAVTFAVVWLGWRHRLRRDPTPPRPAAAGEPAELDRPGLAKGLLATAALLILFGTPLPHVSGVLAVAGALLVSRRLATRRMLGMVDWHLLELFGGLVVVTGAFAATGLPAQLVERLAAAGVTLDQPLVLAPLALIGSNTIGNVPMVVLLLAVAGPASEATLYGLALFSTLAGNLLVLGSLANIILVERAAEVGVRLGFLEHARIGIPVTLLSLALAMLWLAAVAA